jgi:hypothetical protein
MKVTDESQDPAGSRQSDKRIFRTAGHKFSPALGTIIIILVAAFRPPQDLCALRGEYNTNGIERLRCLPL